jgi:hypothetical protein
MPRYAIWLPVVLSCAAPRASGIIISEIHYHPPVGDEALEFVEVANETATPEDISGYAFVQGIDYQFPPGTILGPRAAIAVCLDAAAVKVRYGISDSAAMGNFTGRLDSGGERLTLVDSTGIIVATVEYRDEGRWPVEPDGTGHTLVLRDPLLDPEEPGSWAGSPSLGGSPGRQDFSASGPVYIDTSLVADGALWRYRKGTAPFSDPTEAWRDPAFDDSGWDEGPAGFGYGDGDDRTLLDDMPNSYTSVACRKRFPVTAEQLQAAGDIYLGVNYDDGFRAYLNGAEVGRVNCGAAGEDTLWNATASGSREAGIEDLFPIRRDLLVAGENVLAIAAYNLSISSTDLSLIPRLFIRRTQEPEEEAQRLVFNELCRGAPGGGWAEIYNPGPDPMDLGGSRLTDDPARPDPCVFPAGASIPAGGFLVVDEASSGLALSALEVRLFLLAPDGRALGAACFDRGAPEGLGGMPWSQARFPDGGPLDWVTTTPTRQAPNEVERIETIVINEVFYHPPEDRRGEFIELHNSGDEAVDLSGFRFDKGIDFLFPAGTEIPPGGYLVVTEDPALLAEVYGGGALGPSTGRLSNRGERIRLVDSWGNPVDDIHYHQGGGWSRWADGGGSSLELIDPRQDNSFASAWEGSDESGKSAWENFAYDASYAASGESELHIFLAGRGACRIDDVSIVRGTGTNIIPNPGFETSTASWTIEGTHGASRRTTADKFSGTACLELTATGKGDTLVNRIETETSPAMITGAHTVSLMARWLRGSSLLIAHGQFSAGPYGGRPSPATNLSGNTLGGRLRLTIPRALGTPGAENGSTRLLREAGAVNLGPTIGSVGHAPVAPLATQAVTITARVADADGISLVRLNYRQESAAGSFTVVTLLDDGLNRDGAAGDGVFGGSIPAFPDGIRIVFYLEATDARGVARRHPLEAPARTCLYQVGGPSSGNLDGCRFVLDAARTAELSSRTLHSNDLLDGTFTWNDREAFYNVGIRYRGSPWGRPGRSNFRVRFEDDRRLRGMKAVNLSSRGGAPNDGASHYLVRRGGGPEKPVPVPDYRYIRMWVNGGSSGTFGIVQTYDGDFLEKWCGEEAPGPCLKASGRIQFDDGGNLAAWDGASYIHMGLVTENYRGYLTHSVREDADDWEPFMALSKIMDTRTSGTVAFDAGIGTVLDVEEFLRCLGVRCMLSDWDAFSVGNGHNGYLIFDPRDGLWRLAPFDMDNTFGSTSINLYPSADPSVYRLLQRPRERRIYMRVLAEITGADGVWSSAGAGPFLDALQAAGAPGTGGVKDYINQTNASVRATIGSFLTTQFKIVTNLGNDITTEAGLIELQGDAAVTAATITVRSRGGDPEPLEASWTTPTRWKASFDLLVGDNLFEFTGFDPTGVPLGSDSITVRREDSGTLEVIDWSPKSGPPQGGTVVTFQGAGFTPGMGVLFGGVPSPEVAVPQAGVLTAVAPAAPTPFPEAGVVDIELAASTANLVLDDAFTYDAVPLFIRGDTDGSLRVDLSDAISLLFYLYGGIRPRCIDAADFNDSGGVGLGDVISILNFLFLSGSPPEAPYPDPGPDTTSDALSCG